MKNKIPRLVSLPAFFLSVGLFLAQALLANKKGRQKDSSCYPQVNEFESQSEQGPIFYTSRTYFQGQEALSVEVNPEQTEVSMGRVAVKAELLGQDQGLFCVHTCPSQLAPSGCHTVPKMVELMQ